MRAIAFVFTLLFICTAQAEEVLFRDTFEARLADGWSWRREHPGAWRITNGTLQIRIEPGNMWGPANDAKNVLVRPLPAAPDHELEISLTVSNQPTGQWEQVDLTWYYDDSHMVKIGQEQVDEQLTIVMGREEKDRTRTIAIIPLETARVQLRLTRKGDRVVGEYRPNATGVWRRAGECDLPLRDAPPQVSLQCYHGPAGVERWVTITDFVIRAR